MKRSIGRVLGFLSPRWRPASPCQSCGSSFTCGASIAGCWCLKVKVSPETRDRLRRDYTRCVCRACLERSG